MSEQNYLMINKSTNIIDNCCIWDGNPDSWQPPADYLVLPQATTPAKIWQYSASIGDFELVVVDGAGQIGFAWQDGLAITNEPKPIPPEQPNLSTGLDQV